MIFALALQFHIYSPCLHTHLALCLRFLIVKVLVGAFNKEKALFFGHCATSQKGSFTALQNTHSSHSQSSTSTSSPPHPLVKTARPGRGCSLVLSSGRSADHRTVIINYNERGRHQHLETQAGRRKLRRKEEEDEWCASFIVN